MNTFLKFLLTGKARLIHSATMLVVLGGNLLFAQPLTQTIKGTILDQETQTPLFGANVVVLNFEPATGAMSNSEGAFWIDRLPVGRYDIMITYIGYESFVAREILLSSAKEVVLNIQLQASSISVDEVVVEGTKGKEIPRNSMATVSARTFTVEEARRYAGGMDDPARLAASFAGVTTGAPQDNAIIVRGNSGKGLLWQIEGVRIPSPNHFPDVNVAGGGFVSVLSSHVLDNSDFYTGAFPAEYGNALAGVFDMRIREGNREKQEYTFQAGILGLDMAAEGPIRGLENASYIFNYRYSTFALIKPLIPSEQVPEYSDLAFKITVPTRSYGKFSLWGIGARDRNEEYEQADSSKWETAWDRIAYDLEMGMNAIGFNHKYLLNTNAYIKSSLASTRQLSSMNMYRLDDDLILQDNYIAENNSGELTFSTFLNTRLQRRHTNRTGLVFNRLNFQFDQQAAIANSLPLTTLVDQEESANLVQVYSQSRFDLSPSLKLNAGVHAQYFSTNSDVSIEPRLGFDWKVDPIRSFSLGYGNHSQLEELRIYFIEHQVTGERSQPNRDLELSRAHHLVFGYQQQLSTILRLKVEPYLQMAYNVPVIQDSSFSMLSFKQDLTFNNPLVNKGTGKNYGLDITLERFLNRGMYYLVTASIFESKAVGGDGIERDSRYASAYVVNGLLGTEFRTGKRRQNILGLNVKLKASGGERRSPVNVAATIASQAAVLDESRAFEEREADKITLDMSVTYRKNTKAYSSVWALQVMNVLGSTSFSYYDYDYKSGDVKLVEEAIVVPSLSYKIQF
ncbi:MAG: TonB-dependent receptor [Candidatus Marinimicrobia bacterium]|nr:TonB-dependent receptor [Candidatus Neomarinimicrobiota bacterium]MCF7903533.1 TonB-dependent receptor [Candidatus Neomarinimicrobiota bacterium]